MLERLGDDWLRFHGGRRWRCQSPAYLCEVDDPGQVPSLLREPGIADKLRRIRAFYAGRVQMGALDRDGTALDILVANSMTESYGTVPSPLDRQRLEQTLDAHPELPLDTRLDGLLRQIGADRASRWLVRLEPGYTSPVARPDRVSVGAHHMLLSTARGLASQRASGLDAAQATRQQIVRLAAESLHAAQLAVEYLNNAGGRHQGELPLIAATYNAGSPLAAVDNPWHLRQYGAHIDRWIAYYNASRQAVDATLAAPVQPPRGAPPPPPAPFVAAAALPAGTPAQRGNEEALSAHFTLAEFTFSAKARELSIVNQPTGEAVANLRRLADRLEQVRKLLGEQAIKVNSAYRCPQLNRAVGSKDSSMHPKGLAVDFVCPGFGSPLQVCRALAASGLPFDQLIHEFGSWVHLGLAPEHAAERRQQLTIDRTGTHVGLMSV